MSYNDIVLTSGGLDSAVLLHHVCNTFPNHNVLSLSFLYGQTHSSEVQMALWQANHLGLDHRLLSIPESWFADSTSAIVHSDMSEGMPDKTYAELREERGPSPTYVPFRNGLFLSIATAIALQHESESIWIASHADDAHNWAYPDCTPGFNHDMRAAIYIGSYRKVTLFTPFEDFTKKEIVQLGSGLGVPFEWTVTCYAYDKYQRPCGTCPACVSRTQAFADAELTDPAVQVI